MNRLRFFLMLGTVLLPFRVLATDVCRLHGRVQIVQSHATYKVRVSPSFADLKVKRVSSFPDKPGEWQIVQSGADFTVQIVESGADFSIQFVDAFPGCNQ